jgi:hypothetical protein
MPAEILFLQMSYQLNELNNMSLKPFSTSALDAGDL